MSNCQKNPQTNSSKKDPDLRVKLVLLSTSFVYFQTKRRKGSKIHKRKRITLMRTKLNVWLFFSYQNNNYYYHKLVETFHVVSECNTAIYFSWCLIQALVQPVQLFWPLVTFSVASGDSLTDSDLQLFVETEQDGTRHSFKKYYY